MRRAHAGHLTDGEVRDYRLKGGDVGKANTALGDFFEELPSYFGAEADPDPFGSTETPRSSVVSPRLSPGFRRSREQETGLSIHLICGLIARSSLRPSSRQYGDILDLSCESSREAGCIEAIDRADARLPQAQSFEG